MKQLKLGLVTAVAATGGFALYRFLKNRQADVTEARHPAKPAFQVEAVDEDEVPAEYNLKDIPALARGVLPVALTTHFMVMDGKSELQTKLAGLSSDERLNLTVGLLAAIWLSGLVGHFTKVKEWPATYLYVLGSLGLSVYMGKRGDWEATYLKGGDLKKGVMFGTVAGGTLCFMDIFNTIGYYRRGGKPMNEMTEIWTGKNAVLLYLFPFLIVGEEFFWRGTFFKALQDKGMNKHKVIALCTFLHALNHFAVAPVNMRERALMAGMAVPIGMLNGYMMLKTKNVWSAVIAHSMTMGSMLADIFIIPKLVKPVQK